MKPSDENTNKDFKISPTILNYFIDVFKKE